MRERQERKSGIRCLDVVDRWLSNGRQESGSRSAVIKWRWLDSLYQQNVFWSLGSSGSIWELSDQIPGWSNPRVYWPDEVDFRCTRDHLGAPTTSLGTPTTNLGAPGSADHKPGSADHKPRSTSYHCRAVSENIIFFGNTAVCLVIIATAYCSTIFKTHEFSFCSHSCIYVFI